MRLWTFLHIASMFAAVMVLVGGALLATWAIRRRDLEGLRTYFRIAPRMDSIGGLLFVAGIVFGFVNAWAFGWDLMTGWLLLAYVLVAAIAIVGGSVGPYLKRVKAALEQSDADDRTTISDELEAELARPNVTIAAGVLLLLVALIIWDMVFKPFL
jgi:hypothetical protein